MDPKNEQYPADNGPIQERGGTQDDADGSGAVTAYDMEYAGDNPVVMESGGVASGDEGG